MSSGKRYNLRMGRIEQLTHTPAPTRERTPRTRSEMLDEIYSDQDDRREFVRDVKPMACKCGKWFPNRQALDQHIKAIRDNHDWVIKYCRLCGQSAAHAELVKAAWPYIGSFQCEDGDACAKRRGERERRTD